MKLFWIVPIYNEKISFEIGVTAYDENDAVKLALLAGAEVGSVTRILSLDDLDQNHVRPNMGNHMKRGIWFPIGFEHVA